MSERVEALRRLEELEGIRDYGKPDMVPNFEGRLRAAQIEALATDPEGMAERIIDLQALVGDLKREVDQLRGWRDDEDLRRMGDDV